MKLNIFKKAFSLTELLIVLVIIAILFAAMAPIMTKRNQSNAAANEPVWSFVTNAKDAFFDPGAANLTSAAYFGFSPSSISDHKPYAKVYLRAKNNQNHIQFRFGDNYGNLTGLFSMDDNGNTYTSTKSTQNSGDFSKRGEHNTVAGVFAHNHWNKKINNSVGIGASSLSELQIPSNQVTAVGANTGQYMQGSENVLIGANTGRGKNEINSTVAVGGRVLSIDESAGANNVFLGYGVATSGFNSNQAAKNTIVSSGMYGTTAHNNTIVGYQTYDANFGVAHDITAVGYNSCNSIKMSGSYTNQGPKTCIGTTSADNMGNSVGTPTNWADDPYDHVFIGGKPYIFNGRSILEVHNMDKDQARVPGNTKPNIAPTVVLNSHLVVKGNLFFPEAKSGNLAPHLSSFVLTRDSREQGRDYCYSKCICIFRCRRKVRFHDRKKCYTWNQIGKWFGNIAIGALIVGSIVASGGASTAVWAGVGAAAGLGSGIGELFFGDPSDGKRLNDMQTGSLMTLGGHSCMSADKGYPTHVYCPNLSLSDIRLKENITDNTDSIEKILYVMPYNFAYKNDKTKRPQVGVIAQDLREYLPNSVNEDENGYLNIKWDGIFYASINSLKKLDTAIDNLAENVDEIEADSAKIAKNQKSTKKRIDEINNRINKLENK